MEDAYISHLIISSSFCLLHCIIALLISVYCFFMFYIFCFAVLFFFLKQCSFFRAVSKVIL